MKTFVFRALSSDLFLILMFSIPAPIKAQENLNEEPETQSYNLIFSTYIGGGNWEHARDVAADADGNVYICGGTSSRDFPTTPGAYDRSFNYGDSSGDECDAFICKFSPDGRLIWSTYLGGPGYDRAYGIEVDAQGYVYVAGRSGRNFPTTPGSFQPTFQGFNGGGYGGFQNAFVAKLSPDGTKLIWASYVGVGQLCRDIAIDERGNIYLPLVFPNKGNLPPTDWFANAFQKNPRGGMDVGAVKISDDGSKVLWATWLGGSGDENQALSIRVDKQENVCLGFSTQSFDMPVTDGAFDQTLNGGVDFFVAKLNPTGSELLFGTYLGGSGNEWISTHNLALDDRGNVYASTWTSSPDFPTTSDAFQKQYGGGASDIAVSKFSPTGALLASTYIGGSGDENPDGIYVDSAGNLFITGDSSATNFPVTGNALQPRNGGNHDAVVVLLSPDFSSLLFSTFMGGSNYDNGRSGFLGRDGSLYITGSADGDGYPTSAAAFQKTFAGGPSDYGAGDVILTKLSPIRNAKVGMWGRLKQ